MSYLGIQMKERREIKNLTLEGLSQLIYKETNMSVSRSTLQRIETSDSLPSFDIACCIAHVLEIEIVDLYQETLHQINKGIKLKQMHYERDIEYFKSFLQQFGLDILKARKIIKFHLEIRDKMNEMTRTNKKEKENSYDKI